MKPTQPEATNSIFGHAANLGKKGMALVLSAVGLGTGIVLFFWKG